DNQNVNEIPPKDRRIGMVFQNYALYPHMVSRENLAFSFRLRKWSEYKIDEKIRFTCETLGVGFEALLGRMPRTLSAGQKQRVALGRCIIRNPSVFLMDEPLSNLDAKLRMKTRIEIKRLLNRFKITTVYVTHDQAEAISLADRIAIMREGRIEQVGTFEETYNHPVNIFVAEFIGDPSMNFLSLTLKKGKEGLFLDDDLRIALPGRRFQVLKEKGYVGEEVILGIRPGEIKIRKTARSLPGMCLFKALVEEVEPTVSGMCLFLNASGHDLIATLKSSALIKKGEEIELGIDIEKAKIFDKDSGRLIV
ncbi:MAG: ABC transporter ATP-binding protein, partial [Candidatus Aerophobetes bacterium]|nr:ABC transporter ATP-binding protein [Candidatus Aerophobetes bacterium]